jgi:hypothetical protein
VAIASLLAACSSAAGGPATSADGGAQREASEGDGSSDSGKVDADAAADAIGSDGQVDATVGDAATTDSSPESSASDATAVPALPSLLSATGLFTSVASNGTLVLADGVQEYEPLYPLWADGAQKVRWIYLPPGSKIDTTTSMDHWSFPAGTKLWKEFDLNGKRLETRLVWKYGAGPDDVLYVSYWWNPEAGIPNDAEMADPILGEQDVNGTTHNIPAEQDCETCHNSIEEHVLGFGAIDLNHTLPGANIHTLIEAGTLTTNPSLTDLAIPGNATAQAALGYLHANCGNCHNRSPGFSGVPAMPMYLRLSVGTQTVQETDTYTTAVNQPTTDFTPNGITYRIAGQAPAASCVTYTMEQRNDSRYEMPPLASNVVDDAGVATVSAWITTLPKAP